ncbi:unnamed protein product [Cylicocyclus nassatus]|uniref:Deoxyhypusine synthase n=1 Tax=Cylicocyclus nassatus TaxID=53992 RepID=A0AA36H8L0_CYLNA|nr:unnamed protein product [Cylicocyclus nassatus]
MDDRLDDDDADRVEEIIDRMKSKFPSKKIDKKKIEDVVRKFNAETSERSEKMVEKMLSQMDTSPKVPKGAKRIHGYNFDDGLNYSKLMKSYLSTGFQASNLGKAMQEVNNMLNAREGFDSDEEDSQSVLKKIRPCTIFLGYTSNLVTSGNRDVIRFLVQHKLVDCLVTTAGGVVEDLIKCLKPSYCDDFHMDEKELLSKGFKRDGNILTPHQNYYAFCGGVMQPIIEECVKKQDSGFNWTPSKLCQKLGQKINDETSILYWAAQNKIPVFCPLFTDGFFGNMLFIFAMSEEKLRIDFVDDLRMINALASTSHRTGVLVLGGGVVKEYIDSANLMRGGSDFAVYIGTDTVRGHWCI